MMSLPLNDVKKIIDQAFSSIGYEHQGLTVKLPSNIDVKIQSKDGKVDLDFTNKLPVVSWKKVITLSALIQGVELHQTGGKVKIKYFPDINFLYEQPTELYSQPIMLDTGDIEKEIYSEYPDSERQEIAKRCLQYANEWATICYSSGMTQDDFKSNRQLKRQCYGFVRKSVIEEQRHGSVIISFILIYVILPVVLKWIIEKLFKKLAG